MTRGAVIFLCDLTGNAARPWAEAGYDCYCVDIQHSIRKDRVEAMGTGRIFYVWGDVRSWAPPRGVRPCFGVSFTECTHVAGSGARDWPKKRGFMLRDALEQFEAARQSFEWAGMEYVQENSIGLLSSIPHIGKPSHYFHPHQYAGLCEADNYTKNTALWGSDGFVMPAPVPAPWLGEPDDRIHKATPGDDRANFRSASPMGFWTAVFQANAPHLKETPNGETSGSVHQHDRGKRHQGGGDQVFAGNLGRASGHEGGAGRGPESDLRITETAGAVSEARALSSQERGT